MSVILSQLNYRLLTSRFYFLARWTEKGLTSPLAWTTFVRYQQEVVIPARANQVIDCINYSWTRELDVKLWIQHSFTSFRISLSSAYISLPPHPTPTPPLIWPHEAVELVCKPLSTPDGCTPKATTVTLCFCPLIRAVASVRPSAQSAVRAATAGFAPYLSLGNVIATLRLRGSRRIPSLWELQQSSSLDSVETLMEIEVKFGDTAAGTFSAAMKIEVTAWSPSSDLFFAL